MTTTQRELSQSRVSYSLKEPKRNEQLRVSH
nr:MAG TPA: hypothetical protein [Caudoviricetes sp.]DAI97022.1 MAG TPA: hypothetical protein [Caudoviricetes sp.]DAT60727.1 MAG TPA: hypothetical protein [Caudoviricetes sp.]